MQIIDNLSASKTITLPKITVNIQVIKKPLRISKILGYFFGAATFIQIILLLSTFYNPISKNNEATNLQSKNHLDQNSSKIESNRHPLEKEDLYKARTFISEGKLEESIRFIEKNIKSDSSKIKNQLSNHLAELSKAKKNASMGVISQEDLTKVTNRINLSILDLISDIEDKYSQ